MFFDYFLCIEFFCLVRGILKCVVGLCLINMICYKGKINDFFYDSKCEIVVLI